eukprot:1143383-Pelagomonas_calceolata.AAC.2
MRCYRSRHPHVGGASSQFTLGMLERHKCWDGTCPSLPHAPKDTFQPEVQPENVGSAAWGRLVAAHPHVEDAFTPTL